MKSVFLHIPKTAGRSITGILKKYPDVEILGHSQLKDRHNDLFKFCFVRHPVDRLRSAFHHLSSPLTAPTTDSTASGDRSTYETKRHFLKSKYQDDFNKFVEDLGFCKVLFPHFLPLMWWEPDKMDFIGKFENLEHDWKALCTALQIPYEELPKVEAHKTDYPKQEVSWKSNLIIHDFFKADFERFGYDR